MHPCTHGTQRGHACRAHSRTACTQERGSSHRWPISAGARPGRHAASELAADVSLSPRRMHLLLFSASTAA
eukprot:5403607-Prymnesium_polylepis.1